MGAMRDRDRALLSLFELADLAAVGRDIADDLAERGYA